MGCAAQLELQWESDLADILQQVESPSQGGRISVPFLVFDPEGNPLSGLPCSVRKGACLGAAVTAQWAASRLPINNELKEHRKVGPIAPKRAVCAVGQAADAGAAAAVVDQFLTRLVGCCLMGISRIRIRFPVPSRIFHFPFPRSFFIFSLLLRHPEVIACKTMPST